MSYLPLGYGSDVFNEMEMPHMWLHSLLTGWLLLGSVGLSSAASVSMQWDYSQGIPPAVQFNVYKQPTCTGPFAIVQTQGVASRTWTDTNVTPGQTYCWYITAQALGGEESVPSNTLRFYVPFPAPTAPTNLQGTVNP